MIKLPDDICTPTDLTALVLEIREYSQWYEHEYIKRRAGSASPVSNQPVLSITTAGFLRSISQNGSLQPTQLEVLLGELEHHKQQAPTIAITLAAPATEPVKKTLTAWCRKELSPDILVSFEFNRGLLGGMVVRYGSHVHDWSLRRQLMTTKTSFAEVLARV